MAGKKRTVTQTELIEDDDLEELEPGAEGERVKRTQPIDVKGLPEGVRAVLRLKPWRDVTEYSAYIYRRVPDPTKPGRVAKKFCERVYNTEIEESWLQDHYPEGGRFHIIYQLPHPSRPGDVQIAADDFEVERTKVSGALAAPGVGTPPPVAQAAGGGLPLDQLRQLAEILVMLKGDQAPGPAVPAWIERMYQEKLKRLDEMEIKMERRIANNVQVHNKEPEDENAAWPEFIRPFAPQIKAYGIQTLQALGQKLMGGGLDSMGLRFLVLNNPAFKTMWADPEKRTNAAAAIIGALGEAGENLVKLFMEEMQKRGGVGE